jgi:hypothetical protein
VELAALQISVGTLKTKEVNPTENPGPPGWGLGYVLTTRHHENYIVQESQVEPRKDGLYRRRDRKLNKSEELEKAGAGQERM